MSGQMHTHTSQHPMPIGTLEAEPRNFKLDKLSA